MMNAIENLNLWATARPAMYFTPCRGGGKVRHIDIYIYYALAAGVKPLTGITTEMDLRSAQPTLMMARVALQGFVEFSKDVPGNLFLDSIENAKALAAFLSERIQGPSKIPNRPFNEDEVELLNLEITRLEAVLHKELLDTPIFLATEKGTFSLEKLIRGCSFWYSEKVKSVLTKECRLEIDDAGRALAYDLPTACGFHILRSVEMIVRQYVKLATGSLPPVNRQNWGEFISQLKDAQASRSVTDLLQNIKDNYRNPVMHPEAILDNDEAASLMGICQSAIEALARDMKERGLVS